MSALPQFVPFPDPHCGPSMEEFSSDLARANYYKISDVTSNRNGFVSTRQFFRLLWQASKPARQAAWSLCVWIALLWLVGRVFRGSLMRMTFFHNYAFEAVGVTVSVVVALIVGIANTTSRSWLLIKDLLTGEVTSVEGRLDPTWQEELGEGFKRIRREMVPAYYYLVRQERFEVPLGAYEMLRSKYEDYRPIVRLYFTPRSRMMLSIEAVQADPSTYRQKHKDAN